MTEQALLFSLRAALLVGGLLSTLGLRAQPVADVELALNCTIEPRKVSKIGSFEDGIIEEILVDRGDVVEKGQTLALLESRTEKLAVALARLQATRDVEVRSRQARLGFQNSELDRARTLFKKSMLSHKELDDAHVQSELARLDLESASISREVAKVELSLAEERLARRTIKSPLDGIVTEVIMAPGEYVHEQTPLLSLASVETLNVEVFVPMSRYGQIIPRQEAVVEPVQPIGGRYQATVDVVDRVFDAASGTFGVRLRLDNPKGLLPAGVRCKVRFIDSVRAAK